MTIVENIKFQENRLHQLESRGKDNQEVCRKIRRNIRNLNKRLA